ncbi:DUF6493 family protein [Spirillospora sp. NPDC047279]|uniref:DUF6493 family protein n=1 Tax=Spirillospora sp. NPDC047279 TaxID=3155478 RepID=UPI0033D0A634
MDVWAYTTSRKLDRGSPQSLLMLLTAFGDEERAAVAKALPGHLKELTGGTRNWSPWGLNAPQAAALQIIGAACLPSPAAVAAWLCRRDLDTNPNGPRYLVRHIVLAVAHRPREWRADVARRVAGRLRVADQADRWGARVRWQIADQLARDAGEGLPADDAYTVGYAQWTVPELDEEPYLDEILPRLFEVEAAGRVLDRGQAAGDDPWIQAILRVAEAGRVKRDLLVDGCVRRFLRGGRIQDLRWYVTLYNALEVTPAEAAARTRDLIRLLPAAPSQVADLALAELRRADDLGALDAGSFGEAAEALLFRPEKKLVRAALTWIDRTAAARGRVDAALGALTVAFGQDGLDLQERAARIAARHAGKAAPATREAVRNAAATLPSEARAHLAKTFGEAFGESAGDAETATFTTAAPELPVPPPVRESPPPITSIAELTEAIEAHLPDPSWPDAERLLGGLVDLAHREPERTRAAMRRIIPDIAPWLLYDYNPYSDQALAWVGDALRVLVPPTHPAPYPVRHSTADDTGPAPVTALRARMRETVAAVGGSPLLLATPTFANGHIAPEVLLERLERLEAAGAEPGPLDLDQALLRLPRDVPADVTARAARLTSAAGRRTAAWLAEGGMADPVVTCRRRTMPRDVSTWRGGKTEDVEMVFPEITPAAAGPRPDPHGLGRLLSYPSTLGRQSWIPYSFVWWHSFLPSHREALAAHLLVPMADRTEGRDGQGALLLALADTAGPAGPAVATALILGLSAKRAEERTTAVDALLTFAGRRQLPAAELGTALAAVPQVKLNRVTSALADAARSGAHAEVLAVIAAALPGLLPARAGLADLIALAAEAAETGARVPVPPGLSDVTGTSRVAREATRLHRLLT